MDNSARSICVNVFRHFHCVSVRSSVDGRGAAPSCRESPTRDSAQTIGVRQWQLLATVCIGQFATAFGSGHFCMIIAYLGSLLLFSKCHAVEGHTAVLVTDGIVNCRYIYIYIYIFVGILLIQFCSQ